MHDTDRTPAASHRFESVVFPIVWEHLRCRKARIGGDDQRSDDQMRSQGDRDEPRPVFRKRVVVRPPAMGPGLIVFRWNVFERGQETPNETEHEGSDRRQAS